MIEDNGLLVLHNFHLDPHSESRIAGYIRNHSMIITRTMVSHIDTYMMIATNKMKWFLWLWDDSTTWWCLRGLNCTIATHHWHVIGYPSTWGIGDDFFIKGSLLNKEYTNQAVSCHVRILAFECTGCTKWFQPTGQRRWIHQPSDQSDEAVGGLTAERTSSSK